MPKSGPINRMKNAPKDAIPISKTPRRQRSSRFHVTERVTLERLQALDGKSSFLFFSFAETVTCHFVNTGQLSSRT